MKQRAGWLTLRCVAKAISPASSISEIARRTVTLPDRIEEPLHFRGVRYNGEHPFQLTEIIPGTASSLIRPVVLSDDGNDGEGTQPLP
jgi:predicted transcriptional regulator with HTH domain